MRSYTYTASDIRTLDNFYLLIDFAWTSHSNHLLEQCFYNLSLIPAKIQKDFAPEQ